MRPCVIVLPEPGIDGDLSLLRCRKPISGLSLPTQYSVDPPPLEWSSAMFMKTEDTDGKQATEARGDCHEVTAG